MRRLKAVVGAALLAFLAFAPPGTLIVAVVLFAGLVGGTWALLTAVAALGAVGAIWVWRRRRSRGRVPPEEP